jgi:hypothetical protein
MSAQQIQRNASLEELLEAGRQAFDGGDHTAAHHLWRAAAVANPYEERVWMALLDVLEPEEDREVCLENIIAINPLNPDARRQLRALKRERRLREEQPEPPIAVAPRSRRAAKRAASVKAAPAKPKAVPQRREPENQSGVLARAILTGIVIGLFAVVLGIVASIVVYGGVLPMAAL